jgi:single-strand DNA-binding protein
MAGETMITVVGTMVADAELRFTQSGAAVASFRIASTPRTFNKDSGKFEDSADTLFLSCSVWRQYAENVAESLTKGMQVIVSGRLKQRSYEKDGQKVTVVELDVEDVGPTLRFATAKVTKSQRGGGSGGGGGNGGQSNSGGNSGGDWGSNSGGSVQRSGAQQPGPAPQNDPWATGGGRGGYSDEAPF